jgi:hypothetical protein
VSSRLTSRVYVGTRIGGRRDLVAHLWCVPPESITEDDAWKCVKNDEQRHSHFLFNRTQASALRMRLAATVGLAGAGAPNPAPQGTQAPYMPNEVRANELRLCCSACLRRP